MTDLFITASVSVAVYFGLWFMLAVWGKRYDFVDIAWGGGFIVLTLSLLLENNHNTPFVMKLTTLLVILWGLRLSLHIMQRNWVSPEDKRYIPLRKKWPKPHWLYAFFRIFVVQALLIIIICLPIIAIASAPSVFNSDYTLILGFDIWLIGFLIELLSDWQLAQFLKKKTSKNKVLENGLWKYSRHPNYFGEVLVWWGIWVISLSIHSVWWSVIGPLTITVLILFISGIPPIEKRYKGNKIYQTYAKKTSIFIPLPPKKIHS